MLDTVRLALATETQGHINVNLHIFVPYIGISPV